MDRIRVAIDARMVNFSGIGTYLRGLLTHLPEQAGDTGSFTLFGRPEELKIWPGSIVPARAPIYSLREQWAIPRAFRRSGAGLLHVPHYNVPVTSVSRALVTVHDLIHLKFPQFLPSGFAHAYARFFLLRVVPRARAIITVSEHSKRDLVELLRVPEAKITVTPLGTSDAFHPRTADEIAPILASRGLEAGYLLYVGNLKEFKNVPFLVDTYAKLRVRHPDLPPLVLVGRNSIPGFEEKIRSTPGVRWLSSLEFDQLPPFYCGARALIYPSLYEGFGLPPLEAMASGTPVVCSNRASLPEVVGDAALVVDPESEAELGTAMVNVIFDQALGERLRAAGLARAATFSWRRTAEITWRVMRSAL